MDVRGFPKWTCCQPCPCRHPHTAILFDLAKEQLTEQSLTLPLLSIFQRRYGMKTLPVSGMELQGSQVPHSWRLSLLLDGDSQAGLWHHWEQKTFSAEVCTGLDQRKETLPPQSNPRVVWTRCFLAGSPPPCWVCCQSRWHTVCWD